MPLPRFSTAQRGFQRIFAALADPTRLATVRVLAALGETTCIQATKEAGLSVSRATISRHLRILREAGLIRTRPHGAAKMLTLRKDELEHRHPGPLDVVLNDPGTPERSRDHGSNAVLSAQAGGQG